MHDITLYGTTWNVDCWDIRHLLDLMQVDYDFVDVEGNREAQQWVRQVAAPGARQDPLPVVRFADDQVIVGATRRQVALYFGVRFDTGILRPLALGGH